MVKRCIGVPKSLWFAVEAARSGVKKEGRGLARYAGCWQASPLRTFYLLRDIALHSFQERGSANVPGKPLALWPKSAGKASVQAGLVFLWKHFLGKRLGNKL